MKKNTQHPEITDIKNICDVSGKTKITSEVCDKLNKERKPSSDHKKPDQKK